VLVIALPTSESGLKLLKDVTIAIMSTSALLLTLVLGFIVRTLPQGAKNNVTFGILGLYATIFLDALLLSLVTVRVMSGHKEPDWAPNFSMFLFLVQMVTFSFGLGQIVVAIVAILYS
jgi:hypothetical protein